MTGSSGVSSTPRPLDSITGVSVILDRPVKPGDDSWDGGRLDAVIARSVATKQSTPHMDSGLLRGACHRARIRATRWLAMTASSFEQQGQSQTLDTPPHSRGAIRPSFARQCPSIIEGAGNAGCPLHPQPRVRNLSEAHERSHHRFTGFTRHSPRNGFNGLFRALPGDEFVLSPSSAD